MTTENASHADVSDKHTVRHVVDFIVPGWTLDRWFSWPPDLFLMTSSLLQKTGAYRVVVNDRNWPFEDVEKLQKTSKAWVAALQKHLVEGASTIELPPDIAELKNAFDQLSSSVAFTDLKLLLPGREDALKLSALIVKLHVLADSGSSGFGILSSGKPDRAVVKYLANLLLVTRGSLSAVPKYQGIVIPKFRTPQSGLTLRSFSHHLTYHDTEVEIVWRSIPWINVDQNTLNILCVPWPNEVMSANFSAKDETFESVRYFGYTNTTDIRPRIHGLIEQIRALNQERGTVHMIVFPEMALSVNDYNYLLEYLKVKFESGALSSLPLVLSGVRTGSRDASSGVLQQFEKNEVRLAAYFVGKWYDLSQTKHHRWKLDRNQLRQYELSSNFSTERNWFEDIYIHQRRLSFFAPNAWLALSPLICEDLAQLEPVSEIIRGVGPTLLIALLMDGPQIRERWPARYASIFADDPGTAVLTITSLGMLLKSRLIDDRGKPPGERANYKSIALWKDQLKGWENIESTASYSTALLTISASFREEVTADGRPDGGLASLFKLDNVFYPGEVKQVEDDEVQKWIYEHTVMPKDSIWRGHYHDLRELSSATFAVDALISCYGKNWDVIQDLIIPKKNGQVPPDSIPVGVRSGEPGYYIHKDEYFGYIKKLLFQSYRDPGSAGIVDDRFTDQETNADVWPTKSLFWGLEELARWRETFEKARTAFEDKEEKEITPEERLHFFRVLVDNAKRELERKVKEHRKTSSYTKDRLDEVRIQKAIVLAILLGIHNRLDALRARYYAASSALLRNLFADIENLFTHYNRFK